MKVDTIAAISTAVGEGAIGIVRLSGPEALDISSKLFKGKYYLRVSKETFNGKEEILKIVDTYDFKYTITHDEDDLTIYTESLNSEVMESLVKELDLPETSLCYLRVEA